MTADIAKLKEELIRLIKEGFAVYYFLAVECKQIKKKEFDEYCKKNQMKISDFSSAYELWYSESCRVISSLLPERLEDFKIKYRNEKRKSITYDTYTISDALIGLEISRGASVLADTSSALPKIKNQIDILTSVKARFDKKIADLQGVLQADLFDNELDAAASLLKSGHVRAAGAVAGVVLERHLKQVAGHHGFSTKKKNPTISDFNDFLKNSDQIDTPVWRRIQHLGDIRNMCDHPKDREPTEDEVADLLSGVRSITKTLF